MDDFEKLLFQLIPPTMAQRGKTTFTSLVAPLRDVLNRRKFPKTSLSELQLEWLVYFFSSLDSDKDPLAVRVGEREGRVASPLVSRLASGFNHGVGRSGHVTAPQPKAPGASLMQQVCNAVATDAIRQLGLSNIKQGVVLPLSTGMSIGLTFAALRREAGVKQVLYPRIDHKSPRRGLSLAGMTIYETPTILEGDAVRADLSYIERAIELADATTAVLLTTTFFPPREPDPIKEVAQLCAEHGCPLVVNNAYGVQSPSILALLESAIKKGRVDAIIQSTDKNFLTPVGGAIVVSPKKTMIDQIVETYAGRATAAPIIQTLVALLSLGFEGYEHLRNLQQKNRNILGERLEFIASECGQRVLDVFNPVSCAMTLEGLDAAELGARLYNRRVTGPRAVEREAYGSCIDGYPYSYIVVNSAIGASQQDIELAVTKLYKEIKQLL